MDLIEYKVWAPVVNLSRMGGTIRTPEGCRWMLSDAFYFLYGLKRRYTDYEYSLFT